MKSLLLTFALVALGLQLASAQNAPDPKKEAKTEKKDIKKAKKQRTEQKEASAEGNLQNEQKRAKDDKRTGDTPDLPLDQGGISQDKQKVKEAKTQK
jgi:hypothetical protein